MPRVKRSSRLELEAEDENDWRIKRVISRFYLSHDQIVELKHQLMREMELGLSADPKERGESSLQMAVTFVRDILNGSERGHFLALDLGGTNFRVLDVSLRSGSRCVSGCENYAIPPECLSGTIAKLFDFVADKLAEFVEIEGLSNSETRIPLGFTYSYPLEMKSLTSATIRRVNKALALTDAVGQNPVALLQEAIDRRRIPVEVVVILNDTTGTLMCGAFSDAACSVGLILGTGSNVCYTERTANIPNWREMSGDEPRQGEIVVVNTEWGAFGDNGCIDFLKTDFDFQLDKASLHAGTYTFEKLFSGMYLGELARVTLVHLCQEGLVFGGEPSELLLTPGSLPSSFISRVEQDSPRDLSHTHRCLKQLRLRTVSDEDYHVVRYLANTLSVRAAQMVAAGLSVIIDRIGRPEISIAVDGSLFAKHPSLSNLTQEFLDKYCGRRHARIHQVEDGSGKGAAFTAAVAARVREETNSESGSD